MAEPDTRAGATASPEETDGQQVTAAPAVAAVAADGTTDAATTSVGTARESGAAYQAGARDESQRTTTAVVADPAAPATPARAPEPVVAATEPIVPSKRSNRLFATGIVLLSALLFEVVYLGLVELLALVLGGSAAVGPALTGLTTSGLVWLPLVVFVVLYELLVLLLNRAGRFVYVVASLIVGLVVFFASILYVLLVETGSITFTDFKQLLVNPLFILAGLAAREVMLWTGFAVGAHGKRLRRKNREARDQYEEDRTGRDATGRPYQDDEDDVDVA